MTKNGGVCCSTLAFSQKHRVLGTGLNERVER